MLWHVHVASQALRGRWPSAGRGRRSIPHIEGDDDFKKILIGIAAGLAAAAGADAAAWTGKASYYSLGGRTASGGHVGAFTCAHRTLPFGSKVRVTNLRNHRSVVVTVNDRGPFTGGRVIDVSAQAADALGFRVAGVAVVKVETLAD
jgi:rare lipoprotein A